MPNERTRPPEDDDEEPPSRRETAPPKPTYPMLRDSCRSELVAEPVFLLDDEEPGTVDLSEPFAAPTEPPRAAVGAANLGPDPVPVMVLSSLEADHVALDPEARILLAAVNGSARLSQLATLCGLPRGNAERALQKLVAKRVVRLR